MGDPKQSTDTSFSLAESLESNEYLRSSTATAKVSKQSKRGIPGDSIVSSAISSGLPEPNRPSRNLSKVSDNVTIISDCVPPPDVCVLCNYGISFTKCTDCNRKAHNICIEAFFCTLGKKVDLRTWKCPKCVTITNMGVAKGSKSEENMEERKKSRASRDETTVRLRAQVPNCQFCEMEMTTNKLCLSRESKQCYEKNTKQKECGCGCVDKEGILRYNKCTQHREKGVNCNMLMEDDIFSDYTVCSAVHGPCSYCWSLAWFVLLITLAFPIAIISAPIFIILYCVTSTSNCCNNVCSFFLEGIKLPGTCCRNFCSGPPICTCKNYSYSEE